MPARHNLPPATQCFFGRHEQVTDVKSLLREWRIVTITGYAGVGKTSFAVRVAYEVLDDFDTVNFVAAYRGASPDSLAGLLHLPGGAGPAARIESAAATLGESKVLIVLDACETAETTCRQFCAEILSRCPRAQVLDTGHAKLGVEGELVVGLDGMNVPPPDTTSVQDLLEYDSARLFIEYYCSDHPVTDLSQAEVRSVASICNVLKGFPMAIEVAAAHAKSVGLEEAAEFFREGLPEGGIRGISDLVGETIRWSCLTLSERSRAGLHCFSVFVGGFDSCAASAVCGLSQIESTEVLRELIEARLLVTGWTRGEDFRYQLPQAVADYLRETVGSRDELQIASERHAAYFAELAQNTKLNQHSAEQSSWFRRCRENHGNIVKALDYYFSQPAKKDRAIDFFTHIGDVWIRTGPFDIACDFAKRVASCEESFGRQLRIARALNMAGAIFLAAVKLDDARKALSSAIAHAKKENDAIARSLALSNLAVIYRQNGEYERALTLAKDNVELLRQQDDKGRLATALINCGGALEDLKRFDEALCTLSEATKILEELGDEWTLAWTPMILSEAALNSGDVPTAATNTVKCLKRGLDFGDQRLVRMSLDFLALIASSQGQLEIAATFLGGGDSLVDRHDVPRSNRLKERLGNLRATLKAELGALKSESLLKGSQSLTSDDLLRLAEQVLIKC